MCWQGKSDWNGESYRKADRKTRLARLWRRAGIDFSDEFLLFGIIRFLDFVDLFGKIWANSQGEMRACKLLVARICNADQSLA